jgi:hypothetical protein
MRIDGLPFPYCILESSGTELCIGQNDGAGLKYSTTQSPPLSKLTLACLNSAFPGRTSTRPEAMISIRKGDRTVIDVQQVLDIHEKTVAAWHQQPIENSFEGVLGLVCQQHIFNYELWHQEDIARSPAVSDEQIAAVKRAIDRLNQARNDHIEKLDDWITEQIRARKIVARPDARQNTETPGSAIDRLSIMALRLYHYREQLERKDVNESHVAKVRERIALCEEQRRDLSQSLDELLEDIVSGERRHKTYRQMKMYNDPTLNPYLYKKEKSLSAD